MGKSVYLWQIVVYINYKGGEDTTVFRGLNGVNIDTKGRMAMPARYRETLQSISKGAMVVTIDTEEPCLLLYPLPAWLEIEEKLAHVPSFNLAARRIQRLLIGHAADTEMDAQGRLLLPALLRDYAGLVKHAVLVGQGKKLELWDEQQWEKWRTHCLEEASGSASALLPDEIKSLSL